MTSKRGRSRRVRINGTLCVGGDSFYLMGDARITPSPQVLAARAARDRIRRRREDAAFKETMNNFRRSQEELLRMEEERVARMRESLGLGKRSSAAAPGEKILHVSVHRLRQLMRLCHPDKHAGSKTANEVTAWLNSECA